MFADQRDFLVFRQGAQGAHDSASKGQLENEFGTSKDDEVIIAILEKGTAQESTVSTCLHPLKQPRPPCLTLPE